MDARYLTQDFKGKTLYDHHFPLGGLGKPPEIYMLDMKQKRILVYNMGDTSLAIYDLKGKLIYCSSPPELFF